MLRTILALAVLAGAALQLHAQDFPEPPKPTKEHEWLKQFVGEWDIDSEASFGPEQNVDLCWQADFADARRLLGDQRWRDDPDGHDR